MSSADTRAPKQSQDHKPNTKKKREKNTKYNNNNNYTPQSMRPYKF